MDSVQMITPPQEESSNLARPITTGRLNRWMYEKVRPYLKGRILELGRGSMTAIGLRHSISMETLPVNLADPDFDIHYAGLLNAFDTVVAIDFETPIIYQSSMIDNCVKLLAGEGYLHLLAPASTALYNGLDDGFEQWNRHNQKYIKYRLKGSFDLVKVRYVNLASASTYSSYQATIYRSAVHFFYITDPGPYDPAGLSAIAIAKKKALPKKRYM